MEAFVGALGILGGWTEGMMGKISSREPFEVLNDDPVIGVLLLRPFRGIVPKQPTQLAYCLTQKLTSNTSGRRTNLYIEEQGLPEQRFCDGEDTKIN